MGYLAYNWRMKEILDNGHARAIVVLVALITGTLIMMMNLSGCGQQPSSKASDDGYITSLEQGNSSATFDIIKAPAERHAWNAKVIVRTGITPKPGVGYRISFNVNAAKPQNLFEVFYNGNEELAYGRRRPLPEFGVICIDTGCGKEGKLTAMVVEDGNYTLFSSL